MSHRQTKSSWRPIIEYIQCKSLDLERLRERIESSGNSVERIDVFSFCGNFCESETREVWSDHVVVAGETGYELAEHERRCWEPVQQQHDRGIWVARCPVKDADSVRFDLVDRCNGHRQSARLLLRFRLESGTLRRFG